MYILYCVLKPRVIIYAVACAETSSARCPDNRVTPDKGPQSYCFGRPKWKKKLFRPRRVNIYIIGIHTYMRTDRSVYNLIYTSLHNESVLEYYTIYI